MDKEDISEIVISTISFANYEWRNENNATIPYYHIGTRNPLNLW